MIDWWSSLLLERQIFYAIGIVSLSVLLLQILLTLVGIDAHHGDADLSGHGDHASGLGLLTVRTVTAFFVGFGWGGAIILNHGHSVPVAIVSASSNARPKKLHLDLRGRKEAANPPHPPNANSC